LSKNILAKLQARRWLQYNHIKKSLLLRMSVKKIKISKYWLSYASGHHIAKRRIKGRGKGRREGKGFAEPMSNCFLRAWQKMLTFHF